MPGKALLTFQPRCRGAAHVGAAFLVPFWGEVPAFFKPLRAFVGFGAAAPAPLPAPAAQKMVRVRSDSQH